MFEALYRALAHLVSGIVNAPMYHLIIEVILLMWVIWLIKRKRRPERPNLTRAEEDEIIQSWRPEPLIDQQPIEVSHRSNIWGTAESRPGKYVKFNGVEYLNLISHNYLGFVDDTSFDAEAKRCIQQYGVGSCGPRGFYGTVDVHLDLEKEISKFMKVQETALYSFGFSAIASAIPSYAKSGDLIFVDEFCNFAIQKGLQASKSTIHYFNHNDPTHLARLLSEQAARDRKNPKEALLRRRFCVVEGIYAKTGQLCPLKEIVALAKEYKLRIFLDESISFGTIGETGRGVTEHLGVDIDDLDFICGSMENGLGAFGGFITGSEFVVDHQRISGLGYCFSASLPPFLAGVGILALKKIDEKVEIVQELQAKCRLAHTYLSNMKYFNVNGHELSPIKFISPSERTCKKRKEEQELLDKIILYIKDHYQIALAQPSYLEDEEYKLTAPCVRIVINRLLEENEIRKVISALEEAYENSNSFLNPAKKEE